MSETETRTPVTACTLAELEKDGRRVISAGGRSILVLLDEGKVFALDNRCPHMGFPLHRGTLKDGILTCHWHHAKFDLRGGCTLDPFADDVEAFPVEVKDGVVIVDPRPVGEDRTERWRAKLTEGLEQNIRLVQAKSVIELERSGAADEVIETAALFGIRYRRSGWSPGLTILTAMANVLDDLDPGDRALALFHGVHQVARSTDGHPPDFDLDPLDTTEDRPERYLEWFRRFVDNRSSSAAERVLRAAIRIGLPQRAVADMIFAAATDHLYLDGGHSLDFANKAFELLDHVGWERADEVLPSLIPALVHGERMEETSAWQHPVDIPSLLADVHGRLDGLVEEGGGRPDTGWRGHADLAAVLLGSDPPEILEMITARIREGVPLAELSAAVAYAAALRTAHFHVSNEFDDWNTVHHTFTYANAVDQAMRRAPSSLLARGILDGAMAVYLERFLNVPPQSLPEPRGKAPAVKTLLAEFDAQGRVNETAEVLAGLLAGSRRDEVIRVLGSALLREDAGFHSFQMFEAGVRQHRRFRGRPEGDHVLTAMSRFLTAHSPTVRSLGQTFTIASRLQRGEALHEDA